MSRRNMTAEVLKQELQKLDIHVRYNIMTHTIDITDTNLLLNGAEELMDILNAYICNRYRDTYAYCTKSDIAQTLNLIAAMNPYNPILDRIIRESRHLSDKDYIGIIINKIMNISPDDSLSHTLIRKWFYQSVAILQNEPTKPFGLDGILVLQGKQGIGKTLFCQAANLDSRYYRSIDISRHRDETDLLSKANGVFIGELSELERNLQRKNLELVKAFITSPIDSYRRKYGTSINDYLRRSNYIATCNTTNFLVDRTGNRRFWTIPCENRFDTDYLGRCVSNTNEIFAMAYAQAFLFLKQNGIQSFRLTAEEHKQLEERNECFYCASDYAELIFAALQHIRDDTFTIENLKQNNPKLATIPNSTIGKVLTNELLFTQHHQKVTTVDGKPTTIRVYSRTS